MPKTEPAADAAPAEDVREFIARWQASGGAEMANSQPFIKELCGLLGLPQPDPTVADEDRNEYVFEKAVIFNNGDGTNSTGRIDLYRRGCVVFESKQGADQKAAEQAELLTSRSKKKKHRGGTATRGTAGWDQAMERARQQAKPYAEAVPGTAWSPDCNPAGHPVFYECTVAADMEYPETSLTPSSPAQADP